MKNKITSLLQPLTILKVLAGLSAALALAAILYMANAPRELRATYPAKDLLASSESTVFAPAVRHLLDVPLKWVLVTLLLVTAAYALYNAFRDRRGYEQNLRGRTSLRRWVFFAVSGVLAMDIVAMLCGIQDVVQLKLIAGLVALSAFLGWRAEVDNDRNDKRPLWYSFILQGVSGALPWVAVATVLAYSAAYGMVRLPWYAYAAAAAVFIGSVLLYLNQWNQHRRVRNWQEYALVERNYLLIDAATKTALALILIIGLPK